MADTSGADSGRRPDEDRCPKCHWAPCRMSCHWQKNIDSTKAKEYSRNMSTGMYTLPTVKDFCTHSGERVCSLRIYDDGTFFLNNYSLKGYDLVAYSRALRDASTYITEQGLVPR